MSDWQVGDLAVCVAPVGELQLGCAYVVTELVGIGRFMRDGMHGEGLLIDGVDPPFNKDGFDHRRFLRARKAEA